MNIEAISDVAARVAIADPSIDVAPTAKLPNSFGTWFAKELESVNTGLQDADRAAKSLALGEATSLHDVMLRMEEARLSFQLLAQVRNRALDAYQELMRMQI